MTNTRKTTLTVVLSGIVLSLVLVATHAKEAEEIKAAPLGIEIALAKPFYVPAGKTTKIFIRVPIGDAGSQNEGSITAIRLDPKMEGDKVRVSVYALEGEPNDIRTCSDWDALKAIPVGAYLAGVDEEVALVKLKEFGVTTANGPLTFRVVPKRVLSPIPQDMQLGGNCECGSCGGTNCCANPGMCLGCGSCGYVCCRDN